MAACILRQEGCEVVGCFVSLFARVNLEPWGSYFRGKSLKLLPVCVFFHSVQIIPSPNMTQYVEKKLVGDLRCWRP